MEERKEDKLTLRNFLFLALLSFSLSISVISLFYLFLSLFSPLSQHYSCLQPQKQLIPNLLIIFPSSLTQTHTPAYSHDTPQNNTEITSFFITTLWPSPLWPVSFPCKGRKKKLVPHTTFSLPPLFLFHPLTLFSNSPLFGSPPDRQTIFTSLPRIGDEGRKEDERDGRVVLVKERDGRNGKRKVGVKWREVDGCGATEVRCAFRVQEEEEKKWRMELGVGVIE